MPIKAVLFDMDGVLFDSEPLHETINTQIYRELDIIVDNALVREFVGRTSSDRWTRIIQKFQLQNTVDELNNRQWDDLVNSLPGSGLGASTGLDTLLAFLKENDIRATVASASHKRFVEAVIEHLLIGQNLEGFTSGEEVERCKPAPDIFLLAAKKLGVAPPECLVIEDSSAGVRAGKAAGMYTVGYENPTSPGQDLSPADVRVRNLADICGIIKEMNHL